LFTVSFKLKSFDYDLMPYKEKGLMRPAADLTVYHIIGEEMLKIQTILTPRAF